MAVRKADLAGLYPQRKINSLGNNSKALCQRRAAPKEELDCTDDDAIHGCPPAQKPSLISYQGTCDQDDIDEVEEILRQFDMNLSYGPCLGVSRLERWERASQLGLNPSRQIKDILERAGGVPNCLWEGHV